MITLSSLENKITVSFKKEKKIKKEIVRRLKNKSSFEKSILKIDNFRFSYQKLLLLI